jgi:hypothetical protein
MLLGFEFLFIVVFLPKGMVSARLWRNAPSGDKS